MFDGTMRKRLLDLIQSSAEQAIVAALKLGVALGTPLLIVEKPAQTAPVAAPVAAPLPESAGEAPGEAGLFMAPASTAGDVDTVAEDAAAKAVDAALVEVAMDAAAAPVPAAVAAPVPAVKALAEANAPPSQEPPKKRKSTLKRLGKSVSRGLGLSKKKMPKTSEA